MPGSPDSMMQGGSCCTCGIGRCFGTSFSIHWTLWFNLIFQVVFTAIFGSRSWKYLLLLGIVWGPVAILIYWMHEMGHILRNRRWGGTCDYSMLWPLGGFNNCNIVDGTCLQEFWVAFCGPLMHIPNALLWVVVMAIAAPNGMDYYKTGFNEVAFDDGGAGIWFAELSKEAININLMVMALNFLIPAYPLDCAQMVAALCVHFGLTVEKAGFVLVVLGFVLAVAAIIIGIIMIVGGGGSGIFILLMGLFLAWMTWSLYGVVKAGNVRRHPIFQADCYNKGNNVAARPTTTNLSNPEREASPYASAPRASSPRRKPKGDVEMGNTPTKSAKKKVPSQKKKKTPNSSKKNKKPTP